MHRISRVDHNETCFKKGENNRIVWCIQLFMFIDYFTQALEYRSLLGGSIVAPNPLINRYHIPKNLRNTSLGFC